MTHLALLIRSGLICVYTRTVLLAVALSLVCACLNADSPKTTNSQPDLSAPQVLMLVWSGQGWIDLVNISYDTEVTSETVAQDIASFTQKLGWTVNNLRVTNKKIPVPGAKATTSVTFETTTQIGSGGAAIYIDPIVLSFKRYRNIQISYLVGKNTSLQASAGFDDDQISVTGTHNSGTYQYNIIIKDHNIEQLNWPMENSSGNQNSARKRQQTGFALIVLFAAGCAVAAYYVTKRLTTKQ